MRHIPYKFQLLIGFVLTISLGGCDKGNDSAQQQTFDTALKVCLMPDDLPRASKNSSRGFDYDLGRILARQLEKNFVPVWLPPPDRSEVEASDLDLSYLQRGTCDLMFSVPGAEAIRGMESMLVLSEPYYGSAYELIPEGDVDLLHPDKNKTIAVKFNALSHYAVDQLGWNWTMKKSDDEIIEAVRSGAADYGLIWGPDLAELSLKNLQSSQENAEYSQTFSHPDFLSWNQHVVLARENTTLLNKINRQLSVLQNDGTIEDLLRQYQIPSHPPFEKVFSKALLKNLESNTESH